MKKIIGFVIFVLLITFAYSETYLYLDINVNDTAQLKSAYTFEDTFWNINKSLIGYDSEGFYILNIYNKAGELIDYQYIPKPLLPLSIPFNNDYYKFEIIQPEKQTNLLNGEIPTKHPDDKVLFDITINFCNKNNICEPCDSINCQSAESILTCSDCRSGSRDNYCDLYQDNICDPDCPDKDIDCKDCVECISRNYVPKITCERYGGNKCKDNEQCIGDFVVTSDTEYCCTGKCVERTGSVTIEDYSITKKVPEKKPISVNTYIILIGVIVFILGLTYLVYYIFDKRIIVIWVLGFIVIGGLYVAPRLHNKITGYASRNARDPQTLHNEVIEAMCEVSREVNVPANILMAIAAFEHGNAFPPDLLIEHWDESGNVEVSRDDGGVGLMQITRIDQAKGRHARKGDTSHTVRCGTGDFAENLDVFDLHNNIRCGALFLKEKNLYYPDGKEYYCENSGLSLPAKRAFYEGWQAAVRGYNGWGCGYNLGSEDSINRVQSYVEEVMKRAEYYKDFCDGETYVQGQREEERHGGITIPKELIRLKKQGYYYLVPSHTSNLDFDFSVYDDIINQAKDLKRECTNKFEDELNECIRDYVESMDNWHITSCMYEDNDVPPEDIKSRIIRFCVETDYSYPVYDEVMYRYKETPIGVEFALCIPPNCGEEDYEYSNYLGTYPRCTCGNGGGNYWAPESDTSCDDRPHFVPSEGGKCCNTEGEQLHPDNCIYTPKFIDEIPVPEGTIYDTWDNSGMWSNQPCSDSTLGKFQCVKESNIDFLTVCARTRSNSRGYIYAVPCEIGCTQQVDPPRCLRSSSPASTINLCEYDPNSQEVKSWFNSITAGFFEDMLEDVRYYDEIDGININLAIPENEFAENFGYEYGATFCMNHLSQFKTLYIYFCGNHVSQGAGIYYLDSCRCFGQDGSATCAS